MWYQFALCVRVFLSGKTPNFAQALIHETFYPTSFLLRNTLTRILGGIMKKFFNVIALTTLMILASCGGGGGGSNTSGTVYYTHSELAEIFVERLYTDLGYDIELVKTNTLQYDYIVVYDYDLGQYDAYYIGNYNVGENLGNYLDRYEDDFYYDLIDNFDGTYDGYDPFLDIWVTFEKNQKPGNKNLAKLAKFEEMIVTEKAANKIHNEYGLSLATSSEIARATYALGQEVLKNGRGSITEAESVSVYKAVLGVDPTMGADAMKAYKAGNKQELNNMLDEMVNHFSGRENPESIRSLFFDISGLQQ